MINSTEHVQYIITYITLQMTMSSYNLCVVRLESAKSSHHVKKVAIILVDQEGSQNETLQKDVMEELPNSRLFTSFNRARYCKNGRVIFRVTDVQY